jgi:putative glutamine amidotransferase
VKPLIGITSGEVKNKNHSWAPLVYGQGHTYVDAVIRAGGVPVMLPLTTDLSVLASLSNRLDGLLLSGGNDIDPKLYGQKPHRSVKDISGLRDSTEVFLLQEMLAARKPVLAICRGMQLLNVACGGTLYQDIKSELNSPIDHEGSTKAADPRHIAHVLRINTDSRLFKLLQTERIDANSHHHQAVKSLGKDLRAVARTEDDVVEGIESTDDSFVFGIQAHPESLEGKTEPHWQKLFQAFVAAARQDQPSKQTDPHPAPSLAVNN